jgi:hypothetical protein
MAEPVPFPLDETLDFPAHVHRPLPVRREADLGAVHGLVSSGGGLAARRRWQHVVRPAGPTVDKAAPPAILSNVAKQTVICTYRVRAECESAFRELLASHWETLHKLGFVTDDASVVYRSLSEPPTYVEVFTWVEGGFELAHEHPDVLAVWEPMEPLLEDREGAPKWEFPHYEVVDLTR